MFIKDFRTGGCHDQQEPTKGLHYSLNVYYYISHLLAELPQLIDAKGNIEQSMLESLMPWSSTLPAECYSKRRK